MNEPNESGLHKPTTMRDPNEEQAQNERRKQSTSTELLIAQAIDKNVPIETMERLLAMRRELRAEQAKEAFDKDMAAFQASCPVIEKKKEVKDKYGKILYKYAPLDSIVAQVKDTLGRNGFSYAIKTEMSQTHVTVTCIARHASGHSEESTVVMPLGARTDIMSAPQQVAATLTFGKRYAFCNAFGVMTGDGDIDGAPIEAKRETVAAPHTEVIRQPVRPTEEPLLSAAQLGLIRSAGKKLGLNDEQINARVMSETGHLPETLKKKQASSVIDGMIQEKNKS